MCASRGSSRVRALALCASLLFAACSAPFARPGGTPVVTTYDELDVPTQLAFRAARHSFDAGDVAAARTATAELVLRAPNHIALGILAQEAELATGGADARAKLEQRTRAELEAAPTAARCVLAARAASDVALAEAHLERALEFDPRCAWAHYGLAHLAARAGNWSAADGELGRALELDPFLPPARRLQAMLLARDGRRSEAISAFEAWLGDVADDPRVGARERVEAELDLATLYVLDQEPDAARDLLTKLVLEGDLAVRALCVLAAAEQGDERPVDALNAVRAAEAIDPNAALPWVQDAILRQSWLGDRAGAEEAWRRLLASAETGGDLGRVLLAMRARLALERAERRRERLAGEKP
ncbi:MAG: tetratricopeptide repeat protein [Planctomycetes bacterium]|nr:tetratricopeptide repeat protein [Planctomycetota bacterium]